ncbi:MAG: AbrB/MazE/SpoVT family DNA-binding domain-containing protein [bacterium]|nr:AbrB/MazE/SpoVT family DNA-binding domain-containing protein [bacterium]
MIGYSSVTQKGQVTIPIDIRNYLGIKKGDSVLFVKEHDGVRIKQVDDFFSLKGSVHSKGKKSDSKKMRKSFIDYLSTRKTT